MTMPSMVMVCLDEESTMSADTAVEIVSIDQFVNGLREIPEEDFHPGPVYDYIKNRLVDMDSLAPYTFFSKNHYTRNLIFKNDLFELLSICWEVGQVSQI